MAEKAEKKAEAAPAAASAAPAAAGGGHGAAPAAGGAKKGGIGGLLGKTPVMLGGVMVLEAAVLFAGFKFLGAGPTSASGADIAHEDPAADSHGGGGKDGHGGHGGGGGTSAAARGKTVELPVLEFKAQNKLSGRTFIYDVSVYVVVKTDFGDKVKETIKAREALIKDRVRTIIASNDPEKLGGGSEPGLETLRRQVKHQLDEIIGEGLVEEVLVPRCIPFRTDF